MDGDLVFELSDGGAGLPSRPPLRPLPPINVRASPRDLLKPRTDFERSMQGLGSSSGASADVFRRYGLRARDVCTAQRGMRRLRHSFTVVQRDDGPYIVDAHFRDQFCIPRASAEYRAVLDSIPDVVVVRADRLKRAVAVLTALMAKEFERLKWPTPPWRELDSMLNRWIL